MAQPPFQLPTPLPGSSGAGTTGDVRPIAQWVEPARSGAGLPVTTVELTIPGFYYGRDGGDVGEIVSLWLRKEGGPLTDTVSSSIYVNGVHLDSLILGSGVTEATGLFGIAVDPGDDVRFYVFGTNQTVLSGVLRTPTRLYRLAEAALGRVWVMVDGAWVSPPTPPYVMDGGTWTVPSEVHVRAVTGVWTRLF